MHPVFPEKENLSSCKITDQLDIGRTQIDDVLKHKAEVLADLLNSERNMMSAAKILSLIQEIFFYIFQIRLCYVLCKGKINRNSHQRN
jgi:NADPH-dependent 7-cyano-7-deazaguanine reductase QueF